MYLNFNKNKFNDGKLGIIQNTTFKAILETNKYPNLKLLPISFLSAGLAINFFLEAKDLSDDIKLLEDLELNPKGLKSIKTRKLILGSFTALVAIANTVISFKRFEIRIDDENKTGVGYKF